MLSNKYQKSKNSFIKPFLRWAGGKSLFIAEIIDKFLPKDKINKYFEPFLGAGSVFLAYQPENAILNDLNFELINVYKSIKNNPKLVHIYLKEFDKCNIDNLYYQIREEYNKSKPSAKQSAHFIYLNKSCFNGIFRVNKLGHFNVPYGYKNKLNLPSINHLLNISQLLKKAKLISKDYRKAVDEAGLNDLVYLDPPYPPINGSSYFTHYTKERFNQKDQEAVACLANELSKRGCLVVITNADTDEIREFYKGWVLNPIERIRYITCSNKKHRVGELIITNCSFKGD